MQNDYELIINTEHDRERKERIETINLRYKQAFNDYNNGQLINNIADTFGDTHYLAQEKL